MVNNPPVCTVCSCRGLQLRGRHNAEECKRIVPHPMHPIDDSGYWFCPDHDT